MSGRVRPEQVPGVYSSACRTRVFKPRTGGAPSSVVPCKDSRHVCVLFFREPFSFVDAKSMQLPVRYHAGAHLTGELVWVFATVTQLPHPSVRQSS